MIYLQLFWVFLQVGALSIGGGYAAIPILQSRVVEGQGWLTLGQFTDLITVAEMTPGPITINSATFVGMQVAGVGGAVLATLSCILPSAIIVSLLAMLYFRFQNLQVVQGVLAALRPAILALIASAGLSIIFLAFWGDAGFSANAADLNIVSVCLFAGSLVVLRKFKLNPIIIMVAAGVLGAVCYLLL